jgi:hypothetical protein
MSDHFPSPFTVSSMEDQGFQRAEEVAPPPPPPQNYTLGSLLSDLRQFGEAYQRDADQIRQHHPLLQRRDWIQLGVFVSHARESLLRIPGFNDLRTFAFATWGEEITLATCRRIIGVLIQRSDGTLSTEEVEKLTLADAASLLAREPATTGQRDKSTRGRSEPRVVLRGREEGPIVLGKPKRKLTTPQYNVVQALLDAGDGGLTKDELVSKSGHEDARGILTRLAEKDADWKEVIHFAGQTGGGYRIK